MRRGPIPLNTHAALEPLIAIVIIAAPWIFGFSDADDAKTVCIAVGVVMLIAGSMTDWRFSIARVIPLRTHMMTDLALGAVLILAPFVLGFSDNGGATRFTVIAGALEILTALATRWDPLEAQESAVEGRQRSTPTH
jgi:SPW repeat